MTPSRPLAAALAAALALGGVSLAASPASAVANEMSGTVRDSNGDAFGSGLNVYLVTTYGSPVKIATTNSSGVWTFTGLSAGVEYAVAVNSKDGLHAPQYAGGAWEFEDAAFYTEGEVVDVQLSVGATIQGSVSDHEGSPVDHAQVWLSYPDSPGFNRYPATADVDGEWSIGGVAQASTLLEASDPSGDAQTEFWEDATFESGATLLEPTLGVTLNAIDFELGEAAHVKGTATNPDGDPVANAWAYVWKYDGDTLTSLGSAQTGADGKYQIDGLPGGKVYLEFSPGNSLAYEWWDNEPRGASATSVKLTRGSTVKGISPTFKDEKGSLTVGTLDVTGDLRVGEKLTIVLSGWASKVDYEYQWKFDNVTRDDKLSSKTLTLKASDLGKELDVIVYGYKVGYDNGQAIANLGVVTEGDLDDTPKPTIEGTAKVGRELKSINGSWDDDVAFSYQWTADGVPIDGATSKKYVVESDYLGQQIRVEVTGSKLGYLDVTTKSAKTSPVVA